MPSTNLNFQRDLAKLTISYLLYSEDDLNQFIALFPEEKNSVIETKKITNVYVNKFTLPNYLAIARDLKSFRMIYETINNIFDLFELTLQPLSQLDIKMQIDILNTILIKINNTNENIPLPENNKFNEIVDRNIKFINSLPYLHTTFRNGANTTQTLNTIIANYIQCKLHDLLPNFINYQYSNVYKEIPENIRIVNSFKNYFSKNRKMIVESHVSGLQKDNYHYLLKGAGLFFLMEATTYFGESSKENKSTLSTPSFLALMLMICIFAYILEKYKNNRDQCNSSPNHIFSIK